MSDVGTLETLRNELRAELTQRILPYWMDRPVDRTHGGFLGLVTWDGVVHEDASKGGIVNARILWTFSAAHRVLGKAEYRATADRAAEYFEQHFMDPEHGGIFWMVDAEGQPLDTRKHIYAQAFAIYGLAEHFRATGDERSLARAQELFRLVEENGHDPVHGGYQEAFDRAWAPLEDVRLSEADADERKSMNTHLHLLEAYTNLLRAWPDRQVAERLRELIGLFLDHIIRGGHVCAFFDDDWTPKSDLRSYGHDIETSWLLMEAAKVLGDPALRERVRAASLRIADATLAEGMDYDGGIFNHSGPGGVVDTNKDWWPQMEATVGFVNAYAETGRDDYLEAAWAAWKFAQRYLLDHEHGEWHWGVTRAGNVRPGHEKVGPWKGPYHNGRACLEVIARTEATAASALRAQEAL